MVTRESSADSFKSRSAAEQFQIASSAGGGLAGRDAEGRSVRLPSLIDRVRLGLPSVLVGAMPNKRRAAQMLLAIQFGQLDRLATLRGSCDPFGDSTALFFAVDHLVTTGYPERLPELESLARLSPGYAAEVWKALCLWQEGAQDQALAALAQMRADERLSR